MISICIPVKNGGAEFWKHLKCWKSQQCDEAFEIVVLDSGSRDETVEIAKSAGARVSTIPPEEFSHGGSRNRLAELAQGDLLVFTVADAYPANEFTLAELTRPLREDREIVGVTGKQIPRPDANLIARWETNYHSRMFDKGVRKKRIPSPEVFRALHLNSKVEIISFDDVCSSMRRSIWERVPFSPVNFGEDLDWSYRVMKARHAILHNPQAQIHHSHNRSAWIRSKRFFTTAYFLHCLFEVPPETMGWSEEDAFLAVFRFRLEVMKQRTQIANYPGDNARLRVSRSFLYLFLRTVEEWGPKQLKELAAQQVGRKPKERLCRYFNFVGSEISKYYAHLNHTERISLVDNIEAQVVGDLLGQCYYRSEKLNLLSEEFRQLGALMMKYY